eukprot:scaffold121_cov356-Pavlova_lutheri.AAC.21
MAEPRLRRLTRLLWSPPDGGWGAQLRHHGHHAPGGGTEEHVDPVVDNAVKQLGELAHQLHVKLQNEGHTQAVEGDNRGGWMVLQTCAMGLDEKNWDARNACAVAVGRVARRIQDVQPVVETQTETHTLPMNETIHMDVDQLVESGKHLLVSQGAEFDQTAVDGIEAAKGRLQKALGLHQAGVKESWDMKQLVTDEDLVVRNNSTSQGSVPDPQSKDMLDATETTNAPTHAKAKPGKGDEGPEQGKPFPAPQEGGTNDTKAHATGLSARERNRLKRKRKAEQHAIDAPEGQSSSPYANLRFPPSHTAEWMFAPLWLVLCNALLEPRWEARHGAAIALRELLGHGIVPPTPYVHLCAKRLLCALALDRFGDYGGDRAIAPVREAAAQALGMAVRYMNRQDRETVEDILLRLAHRKEWQPRHGGVVGIKCLLAASADPETSTTLLMKAAPALRGAVAGDCAEDHDEVMVEDKDYDEEEGDGDGTVVFDDDDVRAAAAEALLPAVCYLSKEEVERLKEVLWDVLGRLDDLAASTGSVLMLLGGLYGASGRMQIGEQCEGGLVAQFPKLWPFFRHDLTLVRAATVDLLQQLLQMLPASAWLGNNGMPTTKLVIGEAMRLLFQNLLLETEERVVRKSQEAWQTILKVAPSEVVVHVTEKHGVSWLVLAGTARGQPLDAALLYAPVALPKGSGKTGGLKRKQKQARHAESQGLDGSRVIGSGMGGNGDAARARAAAALGVLALCLVQVGTQTSEPLLDALQEKLVASSAATRQACAMALQTMCAPPLKAPTIPVRHCNKYTCTLDGLLGQKDPSKPTPTSSLPYSEMQFLYERMRTDVRSFLVAASAAGFDAPGVEPEKLDASSAIALAGAAPPYTGKGTLNPAAKLHAAGGRLKTSAERVADVESKLHLGTLGIIAGSRVYLGSLPQRLNPLLQPLMACVRRETSGALQRRACAALAHLLVLRARASTSDASRAANEKLIGNLLKLLCGDSSKTGDIELCDEEEASKNVDVAEVSLTIDEDKGEDLPYLALEASSRGGVMTVGLGSEYDAAQDEAPESTGQKGATRALSAICAASNEDVLTLFPMFATRLEESLASNILKLCNSDSGVSRQVLEVLEMLRIVGPFLAQVHAPLLIDSLHKLKELFACRRRSLRRAVARCCASLASANVPMILPVLLEILNAHLRDSLHPLRRRCAACTALCLSRRAEPMSIAPYLVLLVVPLLSRMGDADHAARAAASAAFALFTPLLPLAASSAHGDPPPGLSPEQVSTIRKDTRFLEQLLDNSKLDEYKLPVVLQGVSLRKYQQDGISWLAFLRRFGLHGILADDMGLGKTIQAAASMAAANAEHRDGGNHGSHRPSLVVCPPTLVGHWIMEIQKYLDPRQLQPIAYDKGDTLPKFFTGVEAVVTSYETLRSCSKELSSIPWLYLVLDEGHAIRNPKTKLSEAVKSLTAHHRVVLSGTPLQNDALELWNIFDFLMPGFLGSEKLFRAKFGRAVRAGKVAAGVGKKASSETVKKAAAEAALAAEALHRQIAPFVLRRTKDEVLDDLPPKILQDVLCTMTPLQRRLYEDFSQSRLQKEANDALSTHGSADREKSVVEDASGHVFASLQYLRRLCVHPLMALDLALPEHNAALKAEGLQASSLYGYKHSPKLVALEELLRESGIGADRQEQDEDELKEAFESHGTPETGHKVLVFAQSRGLLDRIEKDLLQPVMPGVNYLRLDGKVPPSARTSMVSKFNTEPDIEVMLLTTHVGGLGLNLTSADTVVFMEHDWNPMKDLQAMDRAHRLGQKRTVNVYRLIMKDTLEEKIMGLQRFKLDIANTVVSKESVSLDAIDTGQLLDLFNDEKGEHVKKPADGVASAPSKGLKAILEGLEELEDEAKYEEEFAMESYMQKLSKAT